MTICELQLSLFVLNEKEGVEEQRRAEAPAAIAAIALIALGADLRSISFRAPDRSLQ